MWAVSIGHLSEAQLEFLGYCLIAENEEFKHYEDRMGESHLVSKDKPYLMVDDINDAAAMGADVVITVPED